MTNNFQVTPGGDMVIVNGVRTVLTTAGRLASFLSSVYNFGTDASPQNKTVTFPDFTKDWAYNWRWTSQYVGGSSGQDYNLGEVGDGFITAPPQEWSNTTVLAAAPAGCNAVACKIRLNRTTAPNKTWISNTVAVKPPQNVWIPLELGSILVEEQLAMARAMSLYIDGSNNLVLFQQQSVGAAPAFTANSYFGYTTTLGYGATNTGPGGGGVSTNGGEWAYGSQVGLQAFQDPTTMHTASTYSQHELVPSSPSLSQVCRRVTANAFAGGNAGSVTDPTNYQSIYSVDIVAAFGRIS
jgi:hypothetical protein